MQVPQLSNLTNGFVWKNLDIKRAHLRGNTAARQHKWDEGLLTDIKGVQHVAGPLCVVTPAPEVDCIIQQHSCVAVTHVRHFTSPFVSPRPHWGQLHPAQRHCDTQVANNSFLNEVNKTYYHLLYNWSVQIKWSVVSKPFAPRAKIPKLKVLRCQN